MAEVVAFGASVVAFIQLTDRVVSLAKQYLEALQEAPATIRGIFVQVSSLRAILESLKVITDAQDQASLDIIRHLAVSGGAIDLCHRAVADLADLLPEDNDADMSTTSKRKRAQAADLMTRLAWPFKEDRARKKLEEISRYSQSITLALSTQTVQEIQVVKQTIEKMSSSLSATKRREICCWIESNDPSPLHQRTLSLHEEHTGDWVLRTTEWEAWLAGQSRCLWIHGIPGSGKSVLAAFLIQHVDGYCRKRDKYASVFYYCYFGNNHDETIPLLRWVISQLCRRSDYIPQQLVDIYDEGLQMGKQELLSILESVLRLFDTVFLSIDALDESNPREPLLDLVRVLVTDPRFEKLHLLATSREYLEIEEVMASISLPIPMDHRLVRQDIQVYVTSVMKTGRDFRRLSAGLKDHIEAKLTLGAKGMFRWAVCQIDILRRLKTARHIKAALEDLPETLDDTYERILKAIPRHHAEAVRKILLILCSRAKVSEWGPPNVGASQLLTMLSTAEEGYLENPDDNLYDIDAVRDICGCLIRVTRGRDVLVDLAHYTVSEFILSSRCAASMAQGVSFFSISPSDLTRQYGMAILQAGIMYAQLPEPFKDDSDRLDLACSCLDFLRYLANRKGGHWTVSETQDLTHLIWKFTTLNDDWDKVRYATHAQFRRALAPHRERREDYYIFLKLFVSCFSELAIIYLDQAHKLDCLFDLTASWNIFGVLTDYVTFDQRCLHIDYRRFNAKMLQLMDPTKFLVLNLGLHYHGFRCDLGSGDDADARLHYHSSFCPDYNARYKWPSNCCIRTALERGADPNCARYGKTPLQLAVERLDEVAVLLLLDHKADPNLMAPDDGERPQGHEFSPDRRGWSPLRLCRRAPCLLQITKSAFGEVDLCDTMHSRQCEIVDCADPLRLRIERMLVERGARDFILSPDGAEICSLE